jgi:hypothetical protein
LKLIVIFNSTNNKDSSENLLQGEREIKGVSNGVF